METLDLTDNYLLRVAGGRLLIEDRRPWGHLSEGDCFRRMEDVEADGGPPSSWGTYLILEGGMLDAGGHFQVARELVLDTPHPVYGHKVLEGTARYADGAEEAWRIQIDTLNMRVHWSREPLGPVGDLSMRIYTPTTAATLQRWFAPTPWESEGAGARDTTRLEVADSPEVVFLSRQRRNGFRMESPAGGALRVDCAWDPGLEDLRIIQPDRAPWRGVWTFHHAALAPLALSLGVGPTMADSAAAREIAAVDCGQDFGDFYHYLAAPMVLGMADAERLPQRALQGKNGEAPLSFEECAWSAECLQYWSPGLAKRLSRCCLDAAIAEPAVSAEEAAWLLSLAGRYLILSGDQSYIQTHMLHFRSWGDAILGARAAGEALPRRANRQGGIQKDPYFAAWCYAGLIRLRELERHCKEDARPHDWGRAAEAIQYAACSPSEDGGLWNRQHHGFVQSQHFTTTEAGDHVAHCDTSFSFKDNIAAFALGLAEDADRIEAAYEWIDDHYTYATGRGGATFPPRMGGMFYALLDIIVRKRHGLDSVNRLLHRVVDTAFAAPVPLPTAAPDQWGGSREGNSGKGSGAVLDNSAYFALVIGVHYGLEYTYRGWHITAPNPLSYYRLTRVTGLRHGHGSYAVSWQGHGQVARILLNGKPLSHNWLEDQEGDHEVVVFLS